MSDLFEKYQEFVTSTKVYPDKAKIIYPAMALAEEAGEAAGKVAKWLRKDNDLDKNAVLLELGDVLWQVTALAQDLGYTLEEVAYFNEVKLTSRKERGVLQGSGDLR